jgi:hypothetical protein
MEDRPETPLLSNGSENASATTSTPQGQHRNPQRWRPRSFGSPGAPARHRSLVLGNRLGGGTHRRSAAHGYVRGASGA